MNLSGLHLLLTFQCTFECDHCFVWGSPWQGGTMTLGHVRRILAEARGVGTIASIAFEGGEPFLYYGTLLAGVQEAVAAGYQASIVTNAYWATSPEDAVACLGPFAGLIGSISVSSDLYHYSETLSRQAQNATQAAKALGIPVGFLSVAAPGAEEGASGVMYRGRAAEKLSGRAPHHPWETFTACPHETLGDPGRVHVDAYGNLHLCQGIALGNLFERPLREICAAYDPHAHPIVGPLLAGGPAELARRYDVVGRAAYADACHLCYEARLALRERFPEVLCPDHAYGITG